jgi:hypothetical protein
MNFGRSLVLEHQGHPSTSGLIAALFNNDTETVKNGAQCKNLDPKDNPKDITLTQSCRFLSERRG